MLNMARRKGTARETSRTDMLSRSAVKYSRGSKTSWCLRRHEGAQTVFAYVLSSIYRTAVPEVGDKLAHHTETCQNYHNDMEQRTLISSIIVQFPQALIRVGPLTREKDEPMTNCRCHLAHSRLLWHTHKKSS